MSPVAVEMLPEGYTRLEYLKSDGVATMALPFDTKNKSFICWHTLGLPNTTWGVYAYGDSVVSIGYAIRYRVAYQGLSFTGNDSIRNGQFLRGGKYKLGWRVRPHETSGFYFGLLYEDVVLTEQKQGFNQYWRNVYNVFSTAVGENSNVTRVGGATYELTISIEGESVKYVPALDPTGAPCLYGIETRTPYYKSSVDGNFIAGLASVENVRNLYLPSAGGTLTLEVPAETTAEDINQLKSNNPTWELTVNLRTA